MNDTSKTILIHTLKAILKMLHPFMPFVTEEIYTKLPAAEESIMKSKYPEENKEFNFKEAENMDDIIELITKIRRFKLTENVKEISLEYNNEILKQNKTILEKLLKLSDTKSQDKIIFAFQNDNVYLYYDNTQNKQMELEKLILEKQKIQNSIQRREKLLSNENYINKAPKEIVENEKQQLEKEKRELQNIETKLK